MRERTGAQTPRCRSRLLSLSEIGFWIPSFPPMRLSIRNLTKRFGTTTALKSVSLEIGDRELFFLLGPSGCGKTTLLRTIAGFYQPDEGDLLFGDRSMRGVPAHQRN